MGEARKAAALDVELEAALAQSAAEEEARKSAQRAAAVEDEAPAVGDKKPESASSSNGEEDNDTTCVLCMDKERSYTCSPCHHRCICGPECEMLMGQDLLTYLKEATCPICRQPVKDVFKVFGRRRLAPADL